MEVTPAELSGVVLIRPAVFADARGAFMEIWNQARCRESGLPAAFAQDNVSWSRRGVVRGLHYQQPGAQGKLVSVLQGEVFDVAVDLRASSPTFGRWVGFSLSDANHQQLFVPEGFAHGFQALSETAVVHYKCTTPYQPASEHTLRWNDPAVGIRWPLPDPVVSPKDAAGLALRDLPAERLF